MQQYQRETEQLLRLMRAALHGDFAGQIAWDEACRADELKTMILRQDLTAMVYPVIEKQTAAPWTRLAQELKEAFQRGIHKAVTQEYEIQALLDEMEADGIDCLPMKGWIMRDCYPDPLMRSMCDFDVLIRDMDSARMRAWMEARGYRVDLYQDDFHDTYWKQPYMYVELHHSLIDKEHLQPAEQAWVDAQSVRFWQAEARVPGRQHIYRLSDEDFYVHHLSHFYKHFTHSGAGIRFLADTYQFLKAKGDSLDRTRLTRQLEPLHLLDFARRMEQISFLCMEGQGPLPEDVRLVVGYLTAEGLHGSAEVQDTLQVLGRGGGDYAHDKSRAAFKRVFLPMKYMKKRYPRLERSPWLLPGYWVLRGARILFRERYKIGKIQKAQSRERYDDMIEVYRAAGVVEGGGEEN